MNKSKGIVLVLMLVLTVFILDQPLFGQLRPLQQLQNFEQQKKMQQQKKTEQQQQQPLLPGLYIPKPAPQASHQFEMLQSKHLSAAASIPPMAAKFTQQTKTQYFAKAAQAVNSPSALADLLNAFTFSVSSPMIPGKGGITDINNPIWVNCEGYQTGDPGYAVWNEKGDMEHNVVIKFKAKKGFYLLNCDMKGWTNCFVLIQLRYTAEEPYPQGSGGHQQNVAGQSDPQTGIFSFPICMLQDGECTIIFYPTDLNWKFSSCEVIPQS